MRISVDMPDSDMPFLKMCCAQLKITQQEFSMKAILEKVDAYELELESEIVTENEDDEWESLENVMKEFGFNERIDSAEGKKTTKKIARSRRPQDSSFYVSSG